MLRIPTGRAPTHPGEMLLEEFIKPLGLTITQFAEHIGVSRVRLSEVANGHRGVTPDTALRLAKALGTTPEFWMAGQMVYDLFWASQEDEELNEAVGRIEPVQYPKEA